MEMTDEVRDRMIARAKEIQERADWLHSPPTVLRMLIWIEEVRPMVADEKLRHALDDIMPPKDEEVI